MLFEGEFVCAFCGVSNVIPVDPAGGRHQQYTEDCQTCCRPNLLTLEIDAQADEVRIDAEPESD